MNQSKLEKNDELDSLNFLEKVQLTRRRTHCKG